ncbi:hypothetical protein CIB84_000275, partial [Bambusicola thoracicus]
MCYTLDIDESSVMQLAEMGFPLEACRKAVYYTGNLGAEVAFNWIIAHMEEPDFAEPLVVPVFGGAASSGVAGLGAVGLDNQPPEEMVSIIISMGFQRSLAIQALKATNNNLERALEWIFSHPELEEEDGEPALNVMDLENHTNANILAEARSEGPRIKDGPGRYELFGFISHMGTSTMSGHYVCHLKKEGRIMGPEARGDMRDVHCDHSRLLAPLLPLAATGPRCATGLTWISMALIAVMKDECCNHTRDSACLTAGVRAYVQNPLVQSSAALNSS